MNWEAIGAVAELLGALGVIASLVYLATQIRSNTKIVSASTFQANTELWQGWYLAVATSELSDPYVQGMAGREDIDPKSFHQFFLICRSQFLNLENQYYQYRQGVLDEQTFAGYEPIVQSAVLAWPGIRAFWQLNRNGYGPDFVTYIDELLERTVDQANARQFNPSQLLKEWRALLDSERSPEKLKIKSPVAPTL